METDDTIETQDQGVQPDNNQQQQNQPTNGFDAEALKTALSEVLGPRETQQQPLPEMTAEQKAEFLRIWNPDKELPKRLQRALAEDANDEERITPFIELREGVMTQAQRYAELLVEHRMNEIRQQVAPVMAYFQEQQRKQTEETFYGEYPDLKPFTEIVQAIAGKLAASKVSYKTEKEGREILAKAVESVIVKANPGFKLPASTAKPGQKSAGGMPTMTPLSTGASRGSGASNGAEDPAADLWK